MKAYRFKITLKHSHPPIWRRIEIPCGFTFEDFSAIIQSLFGFDGYHLSCFHFPKEDFYLEEERAMNDDDYWHTSFPMSKHYLYEAEDYKRFSYTYDFGDDWEFQIVQEAILEDYLPDYPTLIKHKGNNLVEDCGGIWGYEELLNLWAHPDPNNKMLEWAGDPEIYQFEPEGAQGYLEQFHCNEKEVPEGKTFFEDESEDESDQPDPFEFDLVTVFKGSQIEKKLEQKEMPKSPEDVSVYAKSVAICLLADSIKAIHKSLNIDIDEMVDCVPVNRSGKEILRIMAKGFEEEGRE